MKSKEQPLEDLGEEHSRWREGQRKGQMGRAEHRGEWPGVMHTVGAQ